MTTAENETKTSPNEVKEVTLPFFTLAEVKKHTAEKDCWIIIHGKVVDVSKYLDDHPGGPEIILDIAGTDVTEEFEDTGHSDDARATMKEHIIGTIAANDSKAGNATAGNNAINANSINSFQVLLIVGTLLVAVIAGAAVTFKEEIEKLYNQYM